MKALALVREPVLGAKGLGAVLGDAFEHVLSALAERIAERVAACLASQLATPERAALDRNELAAALGISCSSLDRLRSEPGFPELRIGDAPRFILADVIAYLRSRPAP